MKHLLLVLMIMTYLVACKKETIQQGQEHIKEYYDVQAIGKDTSTSTAMLARTETTGLVMAEDSRLKAVLTAYHKDANGNGVYTIKVYNKQGCRIIIRWGWEGLTIDNITPTSDVIDPNQSKEFVLTGDAKTGKIKLKAEEFECSCGNSSTLIINITMSVLPISFIDNTASYDAKTDKVTVSFTIDDPSQVDWIKIRKNVDGEWKQVMLIGCDGVTKVYNIKL